MAISSIEIKKMDKQDRIKRLIVTMVVDTIGDRTFAIVKSETNDQVDYEVTIDESLKLKDTAYAVDCTCEGNNKWHRTCIHMQAVNALYEKWRSVFTPKPAKVAVTEAPAVVEYDEEIEEICRQVEAELAEEAKQQQEQAAKSVPVAKQTTNKSASTGGVKGNLYYQPFSLPKSYKQTEEEKRQLKEAI